MSGWFLCYFNYSVHFSLIFQLSAGALKGSTLHSLVSNFQLWVSYPGPGDFVGFY